MKIYSTDGSYTENVRDTEFGWSFNDIDLDSGNEIGKTEIFEVKGKPLLLPNPIIEVCGVENAEECQERPVNLTREYMLRNFVNIDSQTPTKEEIASLIEPYSIQSGTLLSVVSNAKLLTYKSKYLQLFIAARASAYRYLIRDKEEIKKVVDEFNLNDAESHNPVSILLELIFTDKPSPIDYFLFNTKASESGSLVRSLLRQKSQDVFAKAKGDADSGVADSISSNNSDDNMRNEVLEIHEDLEHMNLTVERLIEKAEKLEKDLIQTNYLDDLIHLLNGNVDKVKTIKLPFKAFLARGEEQVNLVV
ncbi:uncharacterized protein LOC123679179 isoform X1 [Harmonia axyridis]|uniref:uncharacterized protein LOC123679179 isoform X1 n=1 Tax=Harmonia axyridis TaxID=115357 RepID=UPI001E27536D|nr:uncharacterized protein LOC123679179 isoform X1 [Harmonia axyridis]